MSKGAKLGLILSLSFLLAAIILFVGGMSMLDWDFGKLSTNPPVTNTYLFDEPVRDISVIADTADIKIAPSSDGKIQVVCQEREHVRYAVSVDDGTLEIQMQDTRKWYQQITSFVNYTKVTVYLPEGTYGALSIHGTTGNIHLSGGYTFGDVDVTVSTGDIMMARISAKDLNLSASTGKVTLEALQCRNLNSESSTGKTMLSQVFVAEKLQLHSDTGNIVLDHCDAAEIWIETDTGNVTGSMLTEKVFQVKTETGRIDVPDTITGGRCKISTDTGNILITLVKEGE